MGVRGTAAFVMNDQSKNDILFRYHKQYRNNVGRKLQM
jgi:hypothetical protein